MTIIGIDVSKETLDGVVFCPTENIQTRHQCMNTVAAIEEMLEPLKEQHPDLLVGCESTGMYQLNLLNACDALSIPCKMLNPVLTKEFNRSSIRKKKTDRDDALCIAKLIAQGEGTVTHAKMLANPLKATVRSVRKLTDLSRSLQLHARHSQTLVPELREQYEHLQKEMTTMQTRLRKRAIKSCTSPLRPLLESIPGIGAWTACVILAETNDLQQCRNADALVAFAGLDPRVQQSGVTLNRNGRLTKRGSPHLRSAIFIAASVARMYDPELKAYYAKKKTQGKKFTSITCAISRKLCYRIFAVAKRGTSYEKHEAL